MKTVAIRGTIVDAWFDHAFFAAEIEAGVLTPSSRFVRDLRAALDEDADAPVAIEINSPGGDVFAGGEMLAAIQDAGERVAYVSVGGLAASMAANIALMAHRPLRVHTNSLLYFHSATSDVWGGPGAHADEAALLDKVNAPMMNELVARGVAEERVLEGFEDGRNLVLDADEAREYLGAEIVGEAADLPAKADEQTRARIQNPAAEIDRLADYTATLRAVARLAAWTPDAPAADGEADTASEPPAAREVGKGDREAPCVHGTDGEEVPSSGETPDAPTAPETPQPDVPADAGEGAKGDEAQGAEPEPEQKPTEETPPPAPEEREAEPPAPPPQTDTTAEEPPAAPAETPPATPDATAKAFASLEKQLRSVQSGAAKKINDLKASLAAVTAERDAALRERDEAQGRVAEITQRADALAASLDAERTARADLVGHVATPDSDMDLPPTATPFTDRYVALRTVDERLAFARAHRAELAAERRRAAK